MANTIRGINVKIGAETKGLTAALKDVNDQSKKIGKELSKVNKGLYFNPKSTELLSQKQELLADRIKATSKKLQTLKDSQEQVNRQFKRGDIGAEQYRAFKREVVETENKLETFERQLKETNKEARNLKYNFDGLKKAGKGLATGIATVAAGLTVAGYVVGREINKTMDYADEVDKLSQKMGLTAETTQQWTFIAEQNGTTLESLTNALARFQKNVGDADDGLTTATRSFDDLGVKIEDSNGQLKSMDDIFPETIRKLSEMEDITKRNQLAMNLFGRGGKDLIPILNSTSGEIEDLVKKANDLDLVMEQEDIDSWVDFKDTTHELSEEFSAFKRDLATDLLPFLQQELLPFVKKELIPKLSIVIDKFSELIGLPFAYEGGDEAAQAIKDIETLAEAEKVLAEKQDALKQNKLDLAALAMGGDEEKRKKLEMQQKQLEDEINLLMYRIENEDWNKPKEETGGGGGGGEKTTTDDTLTDLEKFQQELQQNIKDYQNEQKVVAKEGTLNQEIAKLEIEKQSMLDRAKALEAGEETLYKITDLYNKKQRDLIEQYKQESLELEEQYQDEITLLKKEGLEKEIEQLNQQEERELKQAEDSAEARDEIREKYRILREQAREKYAQQIADIENNLTKEIKQSQMSEYEYQKWLLKQQKKELEKTGADKKVIQEWYNEQLYQIEVAYLNKLKNKNDEYTENVKNNMEEIQAAREKAVKARLDHEESLDRSFALAEQAVDRMKEYQYQNDQLSLEQYKKYLEKRLESYDQYSQEWINISNNILSLEDDLQTKRERAIELRKNHEESLDRSFALANNEIIMGLYSVTDNIKTAEEAFNEMKQSMIDGLTEAIVKGESLSDTFENIADQMAAMIIKEGIVQPIVNWGLDLAGLEASHEGSVVSPAGLIRDLPSYHNGGLPGLKNDERVIKVETGERILSRGQNKAFENGEYGRVEIHLHNNISAIDTQSFQQALAKQKDTITNITANDILKNGALRKIIKQHTR